MANKTGDFLGGSLRSNCAARSGQTLDPHRLRPPKQSNQIPKKSPDGLSHITNTPRVLVLRVRRLFSCERDPLSVLFLQQAHRISSFSSLTSVFFFITSFCWFCVWAGQVCLSTTLPLSLVESRFRGRLGWERGWVWVSCEILRPQTEVERERERESARERERWKLWRLGRQRCRRD